MSILDELHTDMKRIEEGADAKASEETCVRAWNRRTP